MEVDDRDRTQWAANSRRSGLGRSESWSNSLGTSRDFPKWAGWLLAGAVVAATVGLWAFEPAETPPHAIGPPPTGDSLRGHAAGVTIPNSEPVLIATILGEMVWQRSAGAEYAAERTSMEEGSVVPRDLELGPESIGWPAALRSWAGRRSPERDTSSPVTTPNGEGEPLRFTVPGLAAAILVEASETPIRVYTLVPGRTGTLLIGDPWGSAATMAWVRSDDGSFELVGAMPFWADYVGVGNRERPLAFPAHDGFVALGRSGGSSGEVSIARPGQELWWSEDGRSWTLIDEDPFDGEDGYLLVLAGYGGRWVGIQPPAVEQSGWVWVSDDGLDWERAAESPLTFGWCSLRVTGGEMGWVARDCGDRPLWLSRDGIEWQPLLGQDHLFADFDYVQGEVWVGENHILVDSGAHHGPVGWVGRLVEEPTER